MLTMLTASCSRVINFMTSKKLTTILSEQKKKIITWVPITPSGMRFNCFIILCTNVKRFPSALSSVFGNRVTDRVRKRLGQTASRKQPDWLLVGRYHDADARSGTASRLPRSVAHSTALTYQYTRRTGKTVHEKPFFRKMVVLLFNQQTKLPVRGWPNEITRGSGRWRARARFFRFVFTAVVTRTVERNTKR